MGITKEITVDIGGKNYKIISDDHYLEHIEDGFEPQMVNLFRTLVKKEDVVFDVGAHIGCTALLFSDLAKSVYAFEPSPTTFLLLQKNVLHSKKQNIFIHNFGLGSETGGSTLTFDPLNRSGGFVSNQIQASVGHIVEKIVIHRLDEEINSLNVSKIDFIKIDVEGFEGQVLRGAMQTLTLHRPVVVLELNHWCLNAFQRTSVPDFFDFLRSLFPILIAIDGSNYRDLHNKSDSYLVMYYHIVHQKYPNIVAAFDESSLSKFRALYQREGDD